MENIPTRKDSIKDNPNREIDSRGAAMVESSQATSIGMADELRGMFQTFLYRVDTM